MATAIESGRTIEEMLELQMRDEVNMVPLELEHNNEVGDLLLRAIVLDNRTPTYAESVFFRGKLGFDDRQLRAELARMRQVVSKLAIVGTQKQREAAEAERIAALDALATEKPKLVKKLEAIQEQIAAIERSATRAQSRSEQIESAVAAIQAPELLRSDLREVVRLKTQEFSESTWGQMNAVEVDIKHLELLLDESQPRHEKLEAIKIYHPDVLTIDQYSKSFQIVETAWTQRKQELREELVELRKKLQELAAVKEQQMAELRGLQGFYLRSNG